MIKKKLLSLSTTQIILLSFLAAVLVGSFLLWLPISSANGRSVGYTDALFTSTTSVCVTGLVTVPTFSTWSVFGQAVILLLIQIGGLGVITVMTGFMLLFNRKMGLGDRLLIQDAFNLNTMAGLARFVKKILLGTVLIEGCGALLYMTVFVPAFDARGIWISVFNAVSAFCNAGIDIIGNNSLCQFATHPLINLTTVALILLGGIGYIVWWDVLGVVRTRTRRNKKIFRHLSLHSKMAIVSTLVLIVGGALLILLFEYDNPRTLAELSWFDKVQVSLFQSVTTRTAGFASLPQQDLQGASVAVSMLLMMIGGSPVGTAGGIKTVTVTVLLCSAVATVRNKRQATVFNRTLSGASIRKAVAVTVMFVTITLSSTVLLAAVTDAPLTDVMFESVSACATVGLSRGLTETLGTLGKYIVIATMYLGRVGPISLAVALGSKNETQNVVSDPIEDISIG